MPVTRGDLDLGRLRRGRIVPRMPEIERRLARLLGRISRQPSHPRLRSCGGHGPRVRGRAFPRDPLDTFPYGYIFTTWPVRPPPSTPSPPPRSPTAARR